MDIYTLIENYKWSKDKPSPKNSITTVELFKLCVELRTIQEVADHLSLNRKTIGTWLSKYQELPKTQMLASHKITGIFNLKRCNTCFESLPFDKFLEKPAKALGVECVCKSCDSKVRGEQYHENPEKHRERATRWRKNNLGLAAAKTKRYEAKKLQRTPAWANQEKIKEIYANCPEGYHVDHILPLQGERVSGLHVENNLQYLPASENISKGNKFQVG